MRRWQRFSRFWWLSLANLRSLQPVRYPWFMSDPYEQDIDAFGQFLRSITSIDEFFERRKPDFRDWYQREMVTSLLEQELMPEADILLGLKQTEKQRYVQMRNELEGRVSAFTDESERLEMGVHHTDHVTGEGEVIAFRRPDPEEI